VPADLLRPEQDAIYVQDFRIHPTKARRRPLLATEGLQLETLLPYSSEHPTRSHHERMLQREDATQDSLRLSRSIQGLEPEQLPSFRIRMARTRLQPAIYASLYQGGAQPDLDRQLH